MSPRWRKMLRDLTRTRARSLLVVLSIAIGVAGVGLIGQALTIVTQGMEESREASAASSAALTTASGMDERAVDAVKGMDGVKEAEGRATYRIRIHAKGNVEHPDENDWAILDLSARKDFTDLHMDNIFPVEGKWPAPEGQLLLERLSARYLNVAVGDQVWLETPDGKTHKLTVAGLVRDPGRETTTLSGLSYGFVSMGTLKLLGLPESFNMLSFTVEHNPQSLRHVQNMAGKVREALQKNGLQPIATSFPDPAKHWASDIVHSMGSILQSQGILALILGAGLVTNTVFAMMTGQLRQIGVMKVLGATKWPLLRMYIGVVLLLGVLALAIGIPLGAVGAKALTAHSRDLLNFDAAGSGFSMPVLLIQASVGLLIPFLAALVPVMSGTRITVREAIAGQGSGAGAHFGEGRFDRWLGRLGALPRPLLLSLRNTFRRKGRLLLTLLTLSLGGAIVVSVFSVKSSMQLSLDRSLRYSNYDVRAALSAPEPANRLEHIAAALPGVTRAEAWGLGNANRIRPDGSMSGDFTLAAPPAGSDLIRPTITEGRWLEPGEKNALVFDTYLHRQEPDIQVGDTLTLSLNGKRSEWKVVGFARKLVGEVVCYVDAASLDQATGGGNRASLLQIVTDKHDHRTEAKADSDLKEALKKNGIGVSSTFMVSDFREVQEARINIVIVFLVMMVVLLTFVSGMGLMGTMSLNVLERTREIGIMRSIGASDRSLWGIVVSEGILIGALSWLIGTLLAYPVSRQICNSVGTSLFSAPLDFRFPVSGSIFWLVLSLALSALASYIPAWNASRLSVRDVLSYE